MTGATLDERLPVLIELLDLVWKDEPAEWEWMRPVKKLLRDNRPTLFMTLYTEWLHFLTGANLRFATTETCLQTGGSRLLPPSRKP